MTFDELYKKVLKDKVEGRDVNYEGIPKRKLDCLFHPEKYPLVWREKNCDCKDAKCVTACRFQALEVVDGKVSFRSEACVGCGGCVEACENHNLVFSKDSVQVVEMLKTSKTPVYALMAPAYIGQFGEQATPGKLRSALKAMGFAGMIEVAAFADILTLKESLEFSKLVGEKQGFQLTSCCCPIWISIIRKDFSTIVEHLPASVSPMIAGGRIAKALHEGCKTVFVGPCMAKKAEIREPDLVGDIDCVLTFQELQDMLDALDVDFANMPEEEMEHSAAAGRMYATAGGVSKAVEHCVGSIQKDIEVKPVCVCGVKECKELLEDILEGKREENFFEGMACPGGCVGGPKRNLEIKQGKRNVDEYVEQSTYTTPAENPYVLDLIKRLGFHTVDEFIHKSKILTRTL